LLVVAEEVVDLILHIKYLVQVEVVANRVGPILQVDTAGVIQAHLVALVELLYHQDMATLVQADLGVQEARRVLLGLVTTSLQTAVGVVQLLLDLAGLRFRLVHGALVTEQLPKYLPHSYFVIPDGNLKYCVPDQLQQPRSYRIRREC
jgi:hypothetical protein